MSSWVQDGGRYEWVIRNNGIDYGADTLLNGKLTDAVYRKISVGNVISRQLTLDMLLTGGAALDPDYPIELVYMMVDSNGDYILSDPLDPTSPPKEWSKGVYYIGTLDSSPYSDEVHVTAFDSLLKAEAVYMKSGTWGDPVPTDYDIAQEIATAIGVSIESGTDTLLSTAPISIVQVPNIGDNGTTMREMLSMIAGLHGRNWILNDDNELELLSLRGNGTTVVVGDEMMSFDTSPAETISRVVVWAGSSMSYRAPTDVNGDPLPDDQWEAIGGAILTAQMCIMGDQGVANALYAMYVTTPTTYVPYTADTVYLGQDSNSNYCGPDTKLCTSLSFKSSSPVITLLTNRTITIDPTAAISLSAEATISETGLYPYMSAVERDIKTQTDANTAAITVADGQISSVVSRTGDAEDKISTLEQTASSLTFTVENHITQQNNYISYDDNTGDLILGTSTNEFKAKLSNTRLAFTGSDGQDAAWISNTQLNINESVIQENGNQRFKASGTDYWVQQVAGDHFRIRWTGGN